MRYSIATFKEHFEEPRVGVQRAHVRIEVGRLKPHLQREFDLGADFGLHLLGAGAAHDILQAAPHVALRVQ
jgi:hypothetical protein